MLSMLISPLLLAYFICTFAVTLALGLIQQREQIAASNEDPDVIHHAYQRDSRHKASWNNVDEVTPLSSESYVTQSGCWCYPELYGLVAVSLIGIQASVSVIVLRGTSAFPPAALFVAFTLLCHHAIIHWNSRFEGETCSCAPFQCKDVSNHETWIVASLVAAMVSLLHV